MYKYPPKNKIEQQQRIITIEKRIEWFQDKLKWGYSKKTDSRLKSHQKLLTQEQSYQF